MATEVAVEPGVAVESAAPVAAPCVTRCCPNEEEGNCQGGNRHYSSHCFLPRYRCKRMTHGKQVSTCRMEGRMSPRSRRCWSATSTGTISLIYGPILIPPARSTLSVRTLDCDRVK